MLVRNLKKHKLIQVIKYIVAKIPPNN